MNAQKVDVAVAKAQLSQLLAGNREARFLDFINPSAFLFFIRPARVENNAVAEFDGRGEIHDDAVADDLDNFAEIDAALFSKTRMNEFLIVRAAKPAGEQPARKCHLHFVAVGV